LSEPKLWKATVIVITTGKTFEEAYENIKESKMRFEDIPEDPVETNLDNMGEAGRRNYLWELKRIMERN
jgi:hypothetical protein